MLCESFNRTLIKVGKLNLSPSNSKMNLGLPYSGSQLLHGTEKVKTFALSVSLLRKGSFTKIRKGLNDQEGSPLSILNKKVVYMKFMLFTSKANEDRVAL